jgi:hypothetical protein
MRNESDRDRVIRQGRQALKMLNTDQNFTWWLDVGDAILIGREEAMREAGTNRPEGGRYNRLFGAWLVREKLDFDKGDRKRLLDVMDNRLAIEEWRMKTLTLVERRKINHPSTVLRKWKAATKIGELRERRTQSNAANFLRRELDDAKAHNAELQAALDARDSSKLTAKQHFSALIELLQDEPQLALQDAVNGFCREVKRAWDVRRQAKKLLRETTAKEKKDEAGQKALSETLGEMGRNLRASGVNISFAGEAKAKTKTKTKTKTKKAKADGKPIKLVLKKHKTIGNAFVAYDYEISRSFDAFSKKQTWTLLQGTDPDEEKRRCIAQGIASKEEVIRLAEADYKKRVRLEDKPAPKTNEALAWKETRSSAVADTKGRRYIIALTIGDGPTFQGYTLGCEMPPGARPWVKLKDSIKTIDEAKRLAQDDYDKRPRYQGEP